MNNTTIMTRQQSVKNLREQVVKVIDYSFSKLNELLNTTKIDYDNLPLSHDIFEYNQVINELTELLQYCKYQEQSNFAKEPPAKEGRYEYIYNKYIKPIKTSYIKEEDYTIIRTDRIDIDDCDTFAITGLYQCEPNLIDTHRYCDRGTEINYDQWDQEYNENL